MQRSSGDFHSTRSHGRRVMPLVMPLALTGLASILASILASVLALSALWPSAAISGAGAHHTHDGGHHAHASAEKGHHHPAGADESGHAVRDGHGVSASGRPANTGSGKAVAAKTVAANTPGFPNIKGGDFRLVDHNGRERTSRDPDGRYQMIFFGYANCKAICAVALPRMVDAVDRLERHGIAVTPVLITVDAARDTVEALGPAVAKIHPRLVGLTGEEARLQEAYDAFQVEKKIVFEHPEHGPVYAHGSYVFLVGPDGTFKTLIPPVVGAERMAEIVEGYVAKDRGGADRQG